MEKTVLPNTSGTNHLPVATGAEALSAPLTAPAFGLDFCLSFKLGHIVYGYLRPYLNKVWVAEFDGCSSVDQFAFEVCQKRANAEFVAAFLQSDAFLRRSAVVTTTGKLPRISIDAILAVDIDLPRTIREQARIAAELTARQCTIRRLTIGYQDQLTEIDAMPAALLRAAFQGQL